MKGFNGAHLLVVCVLIIGVIKHVFNNIDLRDENKRLKKRLGID